MPSSPSEVLVRQRRTGVPPTGDDRGGGAL